MHQSSAIKQPKPSIQHINSTEIHKAAQQDAPAPPPLGGMAAQGNLHTEHHLVVRLQLHNDAVLRSLLSRGMSADQNAESKCNQRHILPHLPQTPFRKGPAEHCLQRQLPVYLSCPAPMQQQPQPPTTGMSGSATKLSASSLCPGCSGQAMMSHAFRVRAS